MREPADRHHPDRRRAYRRGLQSSRWKSLRHRLIEDKNHRCDVCGQYRFGEGELELHHLDYKHWRRERDTDVQVLCRSCHVAADEARTGRPVAKREPTFEEWAQEQYSCDWRAMDEDLLLWEYDRHLDRCEA